MTCVVDPSPISTSCRRHLQNMPDSISYTSHLPFCLFCLGLDYCKSLPVYLPDSNLHSSQSDCLKVWMRSCESGSLNKGTSSHLNTTQIFSPILRSAASCPPPHFLSDCPLAKPPAILSELKLDTLLPACGFGADFPWRWGGRPPWLPRAGSFRALLPVITSQSGLLWPSIPSSLLIAFHHIPLFCICCNTYYYLIHLTDVFVYFSISSCDVSTAWEQEHVCQFPLITVVMTITAKYRSLSCESATWSCSQPFPCIRTLIFMAISSGWYSYYPHFIPERTET